MHTFMTFLPSLRFPSFPVARFCLAGLLSAVAMLPAVATANADSLTRELISRLQDQRREISHEQEIRQLVAERKESLKELMQSSPANLADYTLPDSVRAELPDDVAASLERPFFQEGDLELVYRDEDDGRGKLHYYLHSQGQRLEVFLGKTNHGLRTGMQVQAKGIALDDAVAIASTDDLEVLAYGGEADGSGSGAGVPGAIGAQQVAVLMVNFASQPEVPWTAQQAHEAVFGQASDFIRENSYGQTWLEGDVFGWFTLNVDPVGCPSGDIALAGKQAAAEAGIDLSAYNRIVFAFPDIGCSYSGEATVGGSPSYAWLDGTVTNAGVVSHELGHNLGLYHAHSLDCGADVMNDSCTVFEYGDVLDRMGAASAGHFNAFQKTRLGWVDESAATLISPASSGVYLLDSLSSQSGGAKALRFPRYIDPATGNTQWFYVEYRDGSGADEFVLSSRYAQTVGGGVVIHTGDDGNPNSSGLVDMTPNSQKYDMDDFALPFGASFTDPISGVMISASPISASQVEITLDLGDGSVSVCQDRAPSLEVLSATNGPAVAAGTAVDFTFAVTNLDSAECPSAQIALSAGTASGWSNTFSPAGLLLAPGERAEVIMTLTSPSTASSGYYDVFMRADHEAGQQAAAQVTYLVESVGGETDTEAPSQPQSLAAKVGRKKVDLSWSASTDNVGVAGYRVWRDGVLIAETDGNTFSDFDYQKGTDYQYQVEAFDAAGNLSLPSQQVSTAQTADSTGGGSKGGGKGKR